MKTTLELDLSHSERTPMLSNLPPARRIPRDLLIALNRLISRIPFPVVMLAVAGYVIGLIYAWMWIAPRY